MAIDTTTTTTGHNVGSDDDGDGGQGASRFYSQVSLHCNDGTSNVHRDSIRALPSIAAAASKNKGFPGQKATENREKIDEIVVGNEGEY